MKKSFFNDFVREFFANIDKTIYGAIEWVTQGIFDIAELRTNVDIVEDVRGKIYILLGIFMLFKISASLINYMIKPDEMNDKDKGASKLISRTVVMLAILMFLPTGFDLLYRAQSVFLPILPRFLLNQETEEINQDVVENSKGMAVTIMQTFFHPYYSEEEGDHYASVNGVEEIKTLDEFLEHVNDGSGISNAYLGTKATYDYEYMFLLSTIVGIIVLVFLVGITIDVAIRLFKMLILEMLAPIPILSYIDPKSQKDGPFQLWLKELGKTFIDIFVKLGMIYLVLFFIGELQNNTLFESYGGAEGLDVNPLRLMYLRLFIIVGLLMFLKQAPKFIRGIFGIKEKKDGGSFLGNITGGLIGFGTGAISGAISGRGLRGAITGGVAGMTAGYQGAVSGKPSNAWSTAGDAALQARVGDPKAKSGLLATLQTKAANSQMKAQAAKLGLTSENIDTAKQNMIQAQTEATNAEWRYREILQGGVAAFGGNDTAFNNARTTAYDEWQDKLTISGDKERNYNKAKEAYEKAYGQDEKAYTRYANGPVHRAKKTVTTVVNDTATTTHDNVSTSVGGKTIAQKHQDRTNRIANNGGFNPNK